jgi:hypothetical protein
MFKQEREGHDFSRAVKSCKVCSALAPEVSFVPWTAFPGAC